MTMPFETIFSLLVIQGIFHLLNGCESVGPFQNLAGLDLSIETYTLEVYILLI